RLEAPAAGLIVEQLMRDRAVELHGRDHREAVALAWDLDREAPLVARRQLLGVLVDAALAEAGLLHVHAVGSLADVVEPARGGLDRVEHDLAHPHADLRRGLAVAEPDQRSAVADQHARVPALAQRLPAEA